MDQYQGEDCIAVGSTGTLLSLMGKEMEILQARRSCSVSYSNMKSPSEKDPNTLYNNNASNVFGSPAASPLMTSPSTGILSSLWSDLKGLLKSPTSIHHSPLVYHHNAHSPFTHHNNALFCKELEINEDSGAFCNKSADPRLSTHSVTVPPLRTDHPKPGLAYSQTPSQITRSSPSKELYPKEQSAAVLASCPIQKPSRQTYPKEIVAISYSNQTSPLDDMCLRKKADYPHGKSALHNYPKERLAAGAADYPNRKSPLHYHSQERSAIAYTNQKNSDIYQATPTGSQDHQTRKGGNRPKERSLAGTSAASPNFQYPKSKVMDAASPNLTYPKAKAMDAVYAMRRIITRDADSQNGKLLQEEAAKGRSARTSRNRCSRKREERAICSMQDENCIEKREERGRGQNEFTKRSEQRECMQDEYWCMQIRREERGAACMQEYESWIMKRPMLGDMEKGPCTPASSPVNENVSMSPACLKASRAFGGRSLPPVSVVDLQCCHTPASRERSSRRLSFTRL